SPRIQKKIRRVWADGFVDSQRIGDVSMQIRRHLAAAGHLKPEVSCGTDIISEGSKKVVFKTIPGPRIMAKELVFEGSSEANQQGLRQALRKAKLETEFFADYKKVQPYLKRYYRQAGYLDALGGEPLLELDEASSKARLIVPVTEGQKYRLGELRFAGNRVFSQSELLSAAGLVPGQAYYPGLREKALKKVEELYWSAGYREALVESVIEKDTAESAVLLQFNVEENKQGLIETVQVEGNRKTSERFVRRHLTLSEGDVFDPDKASRSRKNLYKTDAYSYVEFETAAARRPDNQLSRDVSPVDLKVIVRERRPFTLKYGVYFDTDRGPGVIADFLNRNTLGSARVLGLRGRYDSDLKEIRSFFSMPYFFGLPLKSNFTAFRRRESENTFITDRTGFTLQQEMRPASSIIVSYGYRFEQAHTFDKIPDPIFPFDVTLNIAPLTASLSRDSRDEMLSASKGSFTSHAFEYGLSSLGSDLKYVKIFSQFSKYFSLAGPKELPFGAGVKRSRWVFASNVRVGLAWGLDGQEIIPSERFFAGGGTTVRGFSHNTLGPLDPLGDPEGGDAMFVLNNELRFPIYGFLDGVAFLDMGNVFSRVADFDFGALRETAGLGLRVRTPYFLLRLDYGWKLDRVQGETPGALFFSVGQAF
ncbi:outer membrane protein assembly factor, partial [Acidobacteriota bacterium]